MRIQLKFGKSLEYSAGRSALDEVHRLGQVRFVFKFEQKVHMIDDRFIFEKADAMIRCGSTDFFPCCIQNVSLQKPLTPLCNKPNMEERHNDLRFEHRAEIRTGTSTATDAPAF